MVTVGSPEDGFNEPFLVWDKFQIYQSFNWQTQIHCIGTPPPIIVKTYPNPVKRALEYKAILESGLVESQADLAVLLGVSRAKVTQMLNLLKLDEKVQEFMLGLEETDERLKVLTERRLRSLKQIDQKQIQLARFSELLAVI